MFVVIKLKILNCRDLAGPPTERPGLSQIEWASHTKARPLAQRLGLSKRGRSFHTETRNLTLKPGLSQIGQASNIGPNC